jgi:hypothetical protein
MTKKQIRRLKELRLTLDCCAKPLRDVELLRQMLDELLAILLKDAGQTHG